MSGCLVGAKSCDQPLGMQSGEVDYRTITASSFIDDSYRPYRARLHWGDGNYFVGGWCAAENNLEQYIQVLYLRKLTVRGKGGGGGCLECLFCSETKELSV